MNTRFIRIVALSGLVFALLEVVGNGSIGNFPDSDTPISKLLPFYATHHAGIARGGLLLHWAALFLAFFVVAIWARIRSGNIRPPVSAAILLGAAVAVAGQFASAGVYSTLGFIGSKPHLIAPAALQAWHINGAGGGLVSGDGGLAIFLIAVAVAGVTARALPLWLAVPALPLGILQLTPIGYQAEIVFWLWAALAGIYMAIRPAAAPPGDGAAASHGVRSFASEGVDSKGVTLHATGTGIPAHSDDGGVTRWAYRYRTGGRGSKRVGSAWRLRDRASSRGGARACA